MEAEICLQQARIKVYTSAFTYSYDCVICLNAVQMQMAIENESGGKQQSSSLVLRGKLNILNFDLL